MKKLMTMIAAVATSFGLFAANPLPTDNSESFAEATPGTTITLGDESYWAGEGITAAEAVVEEAVGGNVLAIKTGSKALSRKLEKDASAYAIVSNVYFDTEINLMGQALEDFPEVPSDAKIAIFAYNNAEEVAVDPWTALYALASDGKGGKMLYQLSTGIDITEDAPHRITVQAYQNILKDSENVGFKIFIDGGVTVGMTDPVAIAKAYAFDENGKVVWTDVFSQNNYLKGKVIPQLNSVRTTLFVGLVGGGEGQYLTAMDLIGNAKIANIEINEKGFDFIAPDAQLMSLVLNDVTVVADPEEALDADNNILEDCTLTITPATGKTVVKYSYGEGETLLTGNTLDVTMVPGTTLTITAYAEPATVVDAESGEPIEGSPFTSFAAALDAANSYGSACILALKDNVDADDEAFGGYLTFSGNVTLDLAGNTITGSGNTDEGTFAVIVNSGTLTIIDSIDGGAIQPTDAENVAAVINTDGTLNIEKGIFDGKVVNGGDMVGEIIAIGGNFSKCDGFVVKTDIEAFLPQAGGYEVDGNVVTGYWTVVPAKKIDYVNFTVSYDDSKVENVTVTTNGETVADAEGVYTVESNAVVTVAATAKAGYKSVTITGDNVDVEDGVFTADKAESLITIDAKAIVLTAKFVDEDGETELYKNEEVAYNTTPEYKGATPTKTGYTFAGWTPELGPITENATYTATYTPNQYQVTFDVDGGSAAVSPIAYTYGQGEAIQAPDYAGTKSGFEFAGCWTNKTAGGAAYAVGADLPVNVVDGYTLTAVWKEAAAPLPQGLPASEADGYNAWATDPTKVCPDGDTALTADKDLIDAYLLDCAAGVNALKAARDAFKITSIEFVEGEWVVKTATQDKDTKYGNGVIRMGRFSDVECKTPAADGNFFKAKLDFKTAN